MAKGIASDCRSASPGARRADARRPGGLEQFDEGTRAQDHAGLLDEAQCHGVAAADVGAHLMTGLKSLSDAHPLIGDVRGRGLMIGVELVRDRQTKERATTERDAVVNAAFHRGLLLLGAGKNAIRFSPPLVLTKAQADTAVKIFGEALTEVERGR